MIDYTITFEGAPYRGPYRTHRGGFVVRMRSRGPAGTPTRAYFVARVRTAAAARYLKAQHQTGAFSALH